jgi:hypothetical protein
MTNNSYNKVKSIQRKQGLGVEIGGTVTKGKATSIAIGTKGSIVTQPEEHQFHTHPMQSAIAFQQTAKDLHGAYKVYEQSYFQTSHPMAKVLRDEMDAAHKEFSARFTNKPNPLIANMSGRITSTDNVSTERLRNISNLMFNAAVQKKINTIASRNKADSPIDLAKRYNKMGKDDKEIMKEYIPLVFERARANGASPYAMYHKEQLDGDDYRNMISRNYDFNKPVKENIVAPDIDVEAVHALKGPTNVRSIYFDRSPLKEREGK